jgi:hypothetical protein
MRSITFSFLFLAVVALGCDSNQGYRENVTIKAPDNGDLNNTFVEQPKDPELTPEQKFQQEKEKLLAEGWADQNIRNGQLADCYNFTPKYDREIDNYLEVKVGGGTDVAIKVMNSETGVCSRFVFINSGSTYRIKNIPEGKYYLKIAYGKEWLSKVESGQCVGKFIRNPLYEKGSEILDFNLQYSHNGYSIPSFQLQLDVISSNTYNAFSSQDISEEQFNS